MSSMVEDSIDDKLKKASLATKLIKELGIPSVMLLILAALFAYSAKWVGERILLPMIDENRESNKVLRENSNQSVKSYEKMAESQQQSAKAVQEMAASVKTLVDDNKTLRDDSSRNSRNIETILQDIKGLKK